MINWMKRDDIKLTKGKEYLLTDGEKIIAASYETPYNDEKRIWFSKSMGSYVFLEFTHYAEINLPIVEEAKSVRLDAFQLREKIGIDTSISGKGLVDLSKEGH